MNFTISGKERLPSSESTSEKHKEEIAVFEKNVIRNVDKEKYVYINIQM